MALRERGCCVTVGALHENDPDAEIARFLAVPFAPEPPFSLLSYAVLEQAVRLAENASVVVLTAMPFGLANQANLEAGLSLRRAGKPVFCLHGPGPFAARDFTGGRAGKLWSQLLAAGAVIVPDTPAFLKQMETLNFHGSRH